MNTEQHDQPTNADEQFDRLARRYGQEMRARPNPDILAGLHRRHRRRRSIQIAGAGAATVAAVTLAFLARPGEATSSYLATPTPTPTPATEVDGRPTSSTASTITPTPASGAPVETELSPTDSDTTVPVATTIALSTVMPASTDPPSEPATSTTTPPSSAELPPSNDSVPVTTLPLAQPEPSTLIGGIIQQSTEPPQGLVLTIDGQPTGLFGFGSACLLADCSGDPAEVRLLSDASSSHPPSWYVVVGTRTSPRSSTGTPPPTRVVDAVEVDLDGAFGIFLADEIRSECHVAPRSDGVTVIAVLADPGEIRRAWGWNPTTGHIEEIDRASVTDCASRTTDDRPRD